MATTRHGLLHSWQLGLQCGTVSRVARCTAQTLPCRALGSVAGCLRKTSTKFVPSCQHAVRRKHYDSGSMPAPFLDDQDDELRALRNIVRSHNPKTLTEDIKKDILKRVQKVFAPHVMEVVSVSFYTCPVFYAAMQHRSPEWQSMANRLVVIYEPTNADFYSALSNRSRISASRTHLEEWLMVRDFPVAVNEFMKGSIHLVSAFLGPPECLVFRSDSLQRLIDNAGGVNNLLCPALYRSMVLQSVDPFYEHAWMYRRTTSYPYRTFDVYCNSLWTRHFMERCYLEGEPYDRWPDLLEEQLLCDEELQCMSMLTSSFQDDKTKTWICESLYNWGVPRHKAFAKGVEYMGYYPALLQGLRRMGFARRLPYIEFVNSPTDEENLEAASSILKPYQKKMDIWIDRTKFRSLAEDYRSNESPFSAIDPKDLVCVSLSGSKLYNVSLPDSDDDLACVFRWSSPVEMISQLMCTKRDVYELRSFADVVGDRDLASLVGFEARKFVSTIAQGMIEWLQAIFADDLIFETDHFAKLRANRHVFLCHGVVHAYASLISQCVRNGPRVEKLPTPKRLYMAYHKLFQLENLVRGEEPVVVMNGERRDFIIQIRTRTLESNFKELFRDVELRKDAAMARFKANPSVLPSEPNTKFLVGWLSELYGMQLREPDNSSGDFVFDAELDGVRLFPEALEDIKMQTERWRHLSWADNSISRP